MKTTAQKIMDYASFHETFSLDSLYESLVKGKNLSRKALSWHLCRLVEAGKLCRVGRGVFSKNVKQTFSPEPDAKSINIYRFLKKRFPLLNFCVYNGEIVKLLQHHLAEMNNTYVEVERDATEVVFHYLQENYKGVFLTPEQDMMSKYVGLDRRNVVVKALVSESPLIERGGVMMPMLEKLLVDLNCDADFFMYQGIEWEHIMDNAFSLYNVNTSVLLRYAGRRNRKETVEQYLKNKSL